jgi:RNA polymerase sigma factor (sigma-70 family)
MEDMVRLIEPTIPALRRYARALTRDPSEGDDLVQDCLERAVAGWSRRRGTGDARTWLFSILHNLAIDRSRQRRRRGVHVAVEDAGEQVLARDATQEQAIRHADLLRALDALPDDQRSVLLLVSVEDLSYAQVAEVMGVPIGTVMSRLSRGRDRLARMLEAGGMSEASGRHLRSVK